MCIIFTALNLCQKDFDFLKYYFLLYKFKSENGLQCNLAHILSPVYVPFVLSLHPAKSQADHIPYCTQLQSTHPSILTKISSIEQLKLKFRLVYHQLYQCESTHSDWCLRTQLQFRTNVTSI